MHYHLIVHKEDVYLEAKDMNVSKEKENLALCAQKTIEEILSKNLPNVLEIPRGIDPRKIPECIKEKDSVTLYGARHGQCLSGALSALRIMGVSSEYHPNGCI